ncbi:glycosyltransferase family 2 protein [Oleiagrimonas sp.]|jgi:glycosyltransferase involved in cell wall biosynthesis|uniref:glycosyltransferase family 2 protein n=1 Tax=Oleiagrimonas sp. TaxID=2010330 RepID=UPI00262DD7ED|nr:glycosyltransferase family 2 protein [Oleiagrimonas sp.]MDA3913409.1 glycosyltransferase family 2 protein [Oleiagrimonas sp.]
MKLIIQMPCLNEAETLAIALADLPREVEGFDTVEWLIIDDGSTDNTAEIASANGVHHVVRHPVNRGLAVGFMTGIEACLELGADVIVNTDADNQYCGADICKLTAPVLAHEADIVIGARPIDQTKHFSWIKKKLQRLGSWAVRIASGTNVVDAPSGFRAMSREAAMRLNVFTAYTYTLETIIQAGQSNLRISSVAVRTNADLRPSRLVKSIPSYVKRSLLTILRVFMIYRPLAFYFWVGSVFMLTGLVGGGRFLFYYFSGDGEGHVQSVVFASLCVTIAVIMYMMGFIGDLISTNRKLLERIDYRVRNLNAPDNGNE